MPSVIADAGESSGQHDARPRISGCAAPVCPRLPLVADVVVIQSDSLAAWIGLAGVAVSVLLTGGLERGRREGLPVGRQPGAKDTRPRKRSGYVARWERERQAGR